MGNTKSSPGEQVYTAVKNNNPGQVRGLCSDAARQARPDAIRYVDKQGRTALALACSKNYHQCAHALLEAGAEVGFQDTTGVGIGDSALHEAAKGKHEAICELLLCYGANPFVCNIQGRTAMDEAQDAGSSALLRKFEQCAVWKGVVSIRCSKLAGFIETYKKRHIVICPLHAFPKAGNTTPPRKQMLIYKDAGPALFPKSILWLEGASVTRTGPNDVFVLRLNMTHKPPAGDLCWRYDRGYCLYLRPSDHSPESALRWHQLQDVVASPDLTWTPSPPRYSFSGSPANPLTISTPAHPSRTGGSVAGAGPAGGSAGAPGPSGWSAIGGGVYTHPSGGAVSAGGGIIPAVVGGQTIHPDSVGPAWPSRGGDVSSTNGTPQRRESEFATGTQGSPLSASFVDHMQALPGETDSDFARRMASAISAAEGHDQDVPPTIGAAEITPRRSVPCVSGLPPLSTSHSNPFHNLPQAGPSVSSYPVMPPVPDLLGTARVWSKYAWDMLALLQTDRSVAQAGGEVVPPEMLAGRLMQTPTHTPSAPPLPFASPLPAAPSVEDPDNMCVICLSAPKEVGFLHGGSVHRCVCRDCSKSLLPNTPCPICRRPIERILDIFV